MSYKQSYFFHFINVIYVVDFHPYFQYSFNLDNVKHVMKFNQMIHKF